MTDDPNKKDRRRLQLLRFVAALAVAGLLHQEYVTSEWVTETPIEDRVDVVRPTRPVVRGN